MLALSSRLALGVVVPAGPATPNLAQQSALERLQAAMVMCASGQQRSKPSPVPKDQWLDELLLWQHAHDAHALHGSPVSLLGTTIRWEFRRAIIQPAALSPVRYYAAWNARAPPSADHSDPLA